MKAKFAIVIAALSMFTVMLQAGSSPTAPPSQQEEKGSIARSGSLRDDSLDNREDRTEDRSGSQARQDSLQNRQDRAEDR